MAANPNEIITIIVAGGLLGLLGQGIRMAIGLKKLSDANITKVAGEKNEINGTRLLVSLFIGFVAGALFLLVKGVKEINNNEFLFSVIAAGYSGADFIEGLFSTAISKIGTSGNTAVTQPASTTPLSQSETPNVSFAGKERDDESTTNL
ncbi:hypothetical protein [Flavobacterium terrisoli]|uniref:hypothetical protein n=1 Tax=Flavobacterium terrisoli TaxID=3242195 RepID=UPI0025439569|nr:hypothetical protein [Flavobacterium buctense]